MKDHSKIVREILMYCILLHSTAKILLWGVSYKFYIDRRPILPSDPDKIWVSDRRRNFTEIMNDIMFSGGSNKSLLTFSPFGALLTLFFTTLTYFVLG